MPRRSVDHVVMPVDTLDGARSLFERLGFRVAPDARHPFGTGNACVFLADGTYIEPLAVIDRDLAENEAAGGNAFLRHDLSYRLRHALPGFSGLAIASHDAEADAKAFAASGIDGGDVLEFGRRFDAPDGTAADLRFRLAFAAHPDFPATFLFGCQRLFDELPDRSSLMRHANGAAGISRIVYAASDPARAQKFPGAVLGDARITNSFGTTLAASDLAIDILTPDGLAARFGISNGGDKLRMVGLVIATKDLSAARTIAISAGLPTNEMLGRLIVPLSDASATFLAFEEAAAG